MCKPVKAFVTYSHKNKTERDKLIKCLDGMQKNDELETWSDGEISPGALWKKEIANNLAKSDILIYLVSVDSLVSDACNDEIIAAINQGIRFIPVILEACDWKTNQEIADRLALPEDGKPINTWVPESKGWQNVVDGIRKTIKYIREKKGPTSFVALQAGNAFMIFKKFDAAIRMYSSAIELAPDYADAYNNRGIAYAKKKKHNQAIDDYNKAIELDRNYAEAYSNRGNAYWGMNEHDRAIEDCNKAIELNPNLVEAYNNRGITYGKKGGYTQAIADFTKAIELNPDYAEAYNNRGVAYKALGDHVQSQADFKKAIDLSPN